MYKQLMNYKMENLAVFKAEKVKLNLYSYNDERKVFKCEKELTETQKKDILDVFTEGEATYIESIIDLWNKENGELPQDSFGNLKTVSKKAWIKRTDKRGLFNSEGEYRIIKKTYEPFQKIGGYRSMYENYAIIHEWFQELLIEKFFEEQKYFNERDTKMIKYRQVKEYADRFGVLDNKEINDITYNSKNPNEVVEERLDVYISMFEKMLNLERKLEEELRELYPEHNE